MVTVTVQRIGESLGILLPDEVCTRLRLVDGDHLLLTESVAGVQLRRSDPDFERKMTIAEECCRKYGDTLRKLAE